MKHLSMQQLEDLGFKVVKSYTHDEFMTQTRSKGVMQVETMWKKTGEFMCQQLTFIPDVYSILNPKELKQLDTILNKN